MPERDARGHFVKTAPGPAPAPALSADELFMAQNTEKMERTVEDIYRATGEAAQADAGGSVVHSRPSRVTMWKPTPQGYFPRTVSSSASTINMLLKEGWHAQCPDCGGQHGGGVNDCPRRAPVLFRPCPVCGKRIFDNLANLFQAADEDDDPNAIHDEQYSTTTPASRTKIQLDTHLWTRHPRQAQMLNVDPLPVALREMVENTRPV
jgi:hypothetical protein